MWHVHQRRGERVDAVGHDLRGVREPPLEQQGVLAVRFDGSPAGVQPQPHRDEERGQQVDRDRGEVFRAEAVPGADRCNLVGGLVHYGLAIPYRHVVSAHGRATLPPDRVSSEVTYGEI